jgi:hypothetical protein
MARIGYFSTQNVNHFGVTILQSFVPQRGQAAIVARSVLPGRQGPIIA